MALSWFRALAPWLEFREWPDVEKRSLRSRLRVLRVYLTKPEDEIQETAQETQARLVTIREALELVGLALHYDRHAWDQFESIEEKPAEYKHWRRFGDPEDLEPRFELAFDVAHEDQVFELWFHRVHEADVFAWDMHLCERLLQFPPQALSPQFHAARVRQMALVGSAFDASYRLELQFVFIHHASRRPATFASFNALSSQSPRRHQPAVGCSS
jgi:hypothetical protein